MRTSCGQSISNCHWFLLILLAIGMRPIDPTNKSWHCPKPATLLVRITTARYLAEKQQSKYWLNRPQRRYRRLCHCTLCYAVCALFGEILCHQDCSTQSDSSKRIDQEEMQTANHTDHTNCFCTSGADHRCIDKIKTHKKKLIEDHG